MATACGRSAVNRELQNEQAAMKAALRKRAEAAIRAASDDAVFDYDKDYESFSSSRRKDEEAKATAAKKRSEHNHPKTSKYVGKLLKHAQRRGKEQDIIYERKVAREQAAEDANLQFEDKEKF